MERALLVDECSKSRDEAATSSSRREAVLSKVKRAVRATVRRGSSSKVVMARQKKDDDAKTAPGPSEKAAQARLAAAARRRHGARMTPLQEVANAVTQLLPSAWYAYVAYSRDYDLATPAWILIAAVWVHLPFSFVYHCRCAFLMDHVDPIADRWRRLDCTFIHLAAACMAFGTSLGLSVAYSLACATFNIFAASLHWKHDVNQARNQWMTLIAIALYVFPMAARLDLDNFAGALLSLFPSGLCFRTYYFGGYSHAMFHLGMAVFAAFVMNSVLEGADGGSWDLAKAAWIITTEGGSMLAH